MLNIIFVFLRKSKTKLVPTKEQLMVALKTNLRQESFLNLSAFWLRLIIATGLTFLRAD